MRAALGLMQLRNLKERNNQRQRLTQIYHERLRHLDQLELPFLQRPGENSHHLLPILLQRSIHRPDFMAIMANQGVQSSVHYPAIHAFAHYRQMWPPGFQHHLPVTEDVASREVTLPLYPTMSMEQMTHVIDTIGTFLETVPHGPQAHP